MKKTLLSMLALSSIFVSAQETNFLNQGFENWSSKTYSYLDTLESTTRQYLQYTTNLDTIVVEKSTDAYEGSYSALISSKINEDGDTINGYTLLGGWGDSGPNGGGPYTFQADSFSLMYKSDLQPNDTAWVIFQLKKAGSTIGGGQYPISNSTSDWTEFTAPNPAGLTLTPDSIFFACISTNALEDESLSQPGSWIQIDRVGMKKMNGDFVAIQNGGFESWNDTTIYTPDDWYVTNYQRSTDANTGSYSLELSTTGGVDGDGDLDTNSGYLANFNFFDYNQYEGTHYVQQPLALSLWVDYIPANGDSARIDIQFYQNQGWVAGDGHYVNSNTGGFSEVIIPLSFSQAPDTVRLNISSGDHPGSILRIDDVDLTFTPTSTNEVTIGKVSIFPNPASDMINFTSKGSSYKIHNLIGSTIISDVIINTTTQLDVSKFHTGVYFLSIYDSQNNQIETKQFVVK